MRQPSEHEDAEPKPVSARAATKTTAAADALMDWLDTQHRMDRSSVPTVAASVDPSPDVAKAETRGLGSQGLAIPTPAARPDVHAPAPKRTNWHQSDGHESPAPLRLAHTDWLHHRLCISGPAATLAGFQQMAAGAGTVPWQLDFDRMTEDFFHLLAAPPARVGALFPPTRSLGLAGARILADQLGAAVARRQTLAVAQVGKSRACPFDLHALVPVPDDVLRRGPDDPSALEWLWTHWGTTEALRQVADETDAEPASRIRQTRAGGERAGEGRGPEPDVAAWRLTFWSADWTPWRALAAIAGRFPALRFNTQPTYDMP